MKRGDKKAISPLIATVSLVAISVVLFGIIFMWSRSFVSEQVLKFDKPIEEYCSQVSLEVNVERDSDGVLNFRLNNVGNVNIYKIRVIYYYSGGSKPEEYYAGNNEALPAGVVRTFNVESVSGINLNEVDKLEVIPILLGEGEESNQPYVVPCDNAKITVEII